MAKTPNHKCIICGTAYHSCDTCEKVRGLTPWRAVCDSFDHYQIYTQIQAYNGGKDSKENIQAELKKLGVTKRSYADWPAGTKKVLDEIFATSKSTKAAAAAAEVGESVVVDIVETEPVVAEI